MGFFVGGILTFAAHATLQI